MDEKYQANWYALFLSITMDMSVDEAITKMGLRRYKAKRFSKEELQMMVEMREDGCRYKDIAEQFSLSLSGAYRQVLKAKKEATFR